MLKEYYALAKPGIVYGNVFTTVAAFLFASHWEIHPFLLIATVVGIGLVIASASVCNNYLDRGIDQAMARTRSRALVTGAIPVSHALIYACILGVGGVGILYSYVNLLTASVAVCGFFLYVIVYGIYKRRSHWGTVVGSFSGAVPILIGYIAVTDRIDIPAAIIFVTLALWQMPHFYAIAMYRIDDYVAARIPVLPAKKGMRTARLYIIVYIVAFGVVASMLSVLHYAGYTYLAVVLAVSLAWLMRGIRGYTATNSVWWARKLFFFSLIVLIVYSLALATASVLP
jgi:protoheme IX farnesyltransferase